MKLLLTSRKIIKYNNKRREEEQEETGNVQGWIIFKYIDEIDENNNHDKDQTS